MTVEGEDVTHAKPLSDGDQRSIRQVHPHICILRHDFMDSLHVRRLDRSQLDAASED
jgi:hypothetical protein